MKEYLAENSVFFEKFLNENIPDVKSFKPEGTYLLWLDFKGLGLSHEELENLIVNKAKLWLDSGTMFGKEGEGFMRINISCPRSVLKRAFIQLRDAIKN